MKTKYCDYFDYWGSGTEVTVFSGTSAQPSVFPLVACNSGTAGEITLACLASGFYPKTLTFKWKDGNSAPLKSVQHPLVQINDKYTGVSLIKVSRADYSSQSFHCSVTHSGETQSVTFKQAQIPPKVTLIFVPNEDKWTLVCTAEDFSPKTLSIKWKENTRELHGITQWTSEKTGTTYKAVSILKVNNNDWDNKAVYSCEVTHSGKTYTKKTSKAPTTLTLNPPSPQKLFREKLVELECTITGEDNSVVSESHISWKVDGQNVTHGISQSKHEGNQYSKTSTLIYSPAEWVAIKKVRCSAIKEDMTPLTQDLTVHKEGGVEPKVTVHILPENDIGLHPSDPVTLVCLVSSPALRDYYISWSITESQSTNYMDGVTFPPQKTQSGYSVVSVYTTTVERWRKEDTFICNVWPVGSVNTIKTAGVSKSKEEEVCLALSCTDDDFEEDEFSSLWSTTFCFIFLFMSSLVYNVIFSLVKMKNQ